MLESESAAAKIINHEILGKTRRTYSAIFSLTGKENQPQSKQRAQSITRFSLCALCALCSQNLADGHYAERTYCPLIRNTVIEYAGKL